MKKVSLILAILFLTFSCGTKRVIYNNKSEEPKKEVKSKKEKLKKKKSKKTLIAPKILNTEDYVKYYSDIAMDEMIQFGIPASITLAQGILESGAGKGRLAVEANNHFGIKCHDWNGKKIYHDDDEEQECFRKYDNPEYSYRDHSLFLSNRGRYSFLFDFLTVKKLKELLPDLEKFEIDRFELPNIYSLNFYVHGILQDGVSSSTRMDGQAKSLGEYLRAKKINFPEQLLK